MARSTFFHLFPIPKYLQMPAAGLSISTDAVRVIKFTSEDSSLRLQLYGERKLAEGAVVNGEIVDAAEVGRALSECRQKFGLEFVRVTMPDEKVYLFKLSLPMLPAEEIRSALEFKIEENVPIALSEAVFDYTVVSGAASPGLEIVVAASHTKTVASYVEVLRAAGMTPVSIELESQSIANALVARDEEEQILIICFEPERTGIYVADRGIVQFSITIPADDPSTMAVPAMLPGAKNPTYDKLYSPRYKKLPFVREEVERIISYWQGRERDAAREFKCVVCGSEALDHEFMEYFAGLLKRDLTVGNVWRNAFSTDEHIPDISQGDSYRFAPAIGAGIIEHFDES